MKIQHMKYALEVARLGSISKAAELLLLSQPNISSTIKVMEAELGFPIFFRTSKGVDVTPKGQKFLTSARKIVEEYDRLSQIDETQRCASFHLSAGYHSAIEEAFCLFCAEYLDNDEVDFTLTNGDAAAVIERVYSHTSDLGVILLPQKPHNALISACKKRNLVITPLKDLHYNIYLNKSHPLLQEPTFSIKKLSTYPFVDYYPNIISSDADMTYSGFINPNKTILVDDRDTRYHLISSTDAFSIGCEAHPRIRGRYNLEIIPLPGTIFRMVTLQRQDHEPALEEKRYLQLLRQVLQEVE